MGRRIEFKAYGGTGSLIGRCFVTLMALNAGGCAKDDTCVIYQMDYDDLPPTAGQQNDSTYFQHMIENYQKLHDRNLGFLAPANMQRSLMTLKEVRVHAYGQEEDVYSLDSLYCRKTNGAEIKTILSSAFTTDPSSNVEEIERSNRDGCYGDLAVNGFISERLMSAHSFQNKGAYNDLRASLNDAIVFYAGSTDGGTANTMIDKDIESMLAFLNASGSDITKNRIFHVYGLRTTPYSKFKVDVGDAIDREITKDILKNKYAMSKGVFENIQRQNAGADNSDVHKYSYYYMQPNTNYWLDGLFVGSSDKLDLTADTAKKDNQLHPSHLVEFALAQQAMDAIANRLPSDNGGATPHLYAYNDGCAVANGINNGSVTLESFFKNMTVSYNYGLLHNEEDGTGIKLSKYIRAVLLTLATVKGRLISDFQELNASYITKGIFKGAGDDLEVVAPHVVQELQDFLKEAKFIVMTFVDLMDYSKFDASDTPVDFVESAIRYIYDDNNPMPAGCGLSVEETGENNYRISASQNPEFPLVDDLANKRFEAGGILGGGKLKNIKPYLNTLQGTTEAESGRNVANDIIRRVFEVYLKSL